MILTKRPEVDAEGLCASSEGLIRLSGTDFRRSDVSCSSCGWTGVAAKLRNPDLDTLQGEVTYACPECRRLVAVHVGLTDGEVLTEMQRIGQLLAAEAKSGLVQTVEPRGEHDDSGALDFHLIRERFPHQRGRIRRESNASVCSASPPEPERTDLSFADIRARLGIG